ncbi:MAG TPA: sugar-binding transcriptional regulator [Acetobacteraceae bacterium]|nr:sugar-binding transcriptional regulator [Acetobacteraceae bacterium]
MSRPPQDPTERGQRRLDLAARAAWLYYVGGRTQDEIAARLNLSRQGTQRLIALAREHGLIKFRLDHRIAECVELAERLQAAFDLSFSDVVPAGEEALLSVAISAAAQIETCLLGRVPLVIALGTGRTMRAAVQQVPALDRPQHRIVSLVGNLTRDGRASPYDVVMRLADQAGAQCYPLPLPVVADTAEERGRMQAQRSYATVHDLAAQASVRFVGVSGIAPDGPLRRDGFITEAELAELLARGAVGEICGWSFDAEGVLIEGAVNARITAIPLDRPAAQPRIGVACGGEKVAALRAALRGRLLTGLITDEATAAAVLLEA